MKFNLNYRVILTIVIFLSIGVIAGTSWAISGEIRDAMAGCSSLNGNYSFDASGHFCNGQRISKFIYCHNLIAERICEERWEYDSAY